jgi:hypothetical protein
MDQHCGLAVPLRCLRSQVTDHYSLARSWRRFVFACVLLNGWLAGSENDW